MCECVCVLWESLTTCKTLISKYMCIKIKPYISRYKLTPGGLTGLCLRGRLLDSRDSFIHAIQHYITDARVTVGSPRCYFFVLLFNESRYSYTTCVIMPQSYHTPGPRTGTVPGLFRNKFVHPRTGPARRRRNFFFPHWARRVISLQARVALEIVNSLQITCAVSVRGHTAPHDHTWRPCGILPFVKHLAWP